MIDTFTALSLRERILIGAALLVGLLLIAYIYLWEPKMKQLKNLRDIKVPQSEQTLAWVEQALMHAQNSPADARKKIIEGPLLTVIEQTAEKAGVRASIRRMQPNQAQAVKIWMEEVPFDSWLRWIELLRQQNVFVERASIVKHSPGLVTIRVTLGRN